MVFFLLRWKYLRIFIQFSKPELLQLFLACIMLGLTILDGEVKEKMKCMFECLYQYPHVIQTSSSYVTHETVDGANAVTMLICVNTERSGGVHAFMQGLGGSVVVACSYFLQVVSRFIGYSPPTFVSVFRAMYDVDSFF